MFYKKTRRINRRSRQFSPNKYPVHPLKKQTKEKNIFKMINGSSNKFINCCFFFQGLSSSYRLLTMVLKIGRVYVDCRIDLDSASGDSSQPPIHIYGRFLSIVRFLRLFPIFFKEVSKGSNKVLRWVLKIKTNYFTRSNDTKGESCYSSGHKQQISNPMNRPPN